jgi:hypothetical protein
MKVWVKKDIVATEGLWPLFILVFIFYHQHPQVEYKGW